VELGKALCNALLPRLDEASSGFVYVVAEAVRTSVSR
jgi:hypothetical protein